ncbi:MAG: amidohydrolase family protein, partial [Clostridia bacterium]|nr:amidohydrolase family protein [Clostridia bacterium]
FICALEKELPEEGTVIDGKGTITMPGFINSRSRAFVSRIARCFPEDYNCDFWKGSPNYLRINPFVNIALEILDDEEIKALLELALYEAIDGGTTTLVDQGINRDVALMLNLCHKKGVRCLSAPMLSNKSKLAEVGFWNDVDFDTDIDDAEALEKLKWNKALIYKWRESEIVQAAYGLNSPEVCSSSFIRDVVTESKKDDAFLLISCNETKMEREEAFKKHSLYPVELLRKCDALTPRTILNGMSQTSKEDINILKSFLSKVAYCPQEAALDSSMPMFLPFRDHHINIALGTGRTSVSILEQLRAMAITSKLDSGKRQNIQSVDVLYAATEAGRRNYRNKKIGKIQTGFAADLIMIDAEKPNLTPGYLPVVDIVYHLRSSDIKNVIVQGKQIKDNGKVIGFNISKDISTAKKAIEKVWTQANKHCVF